MRARRIFLALDPFWVYQRQYKYVSVQRSYGMMVHRKLIQEIRVQVRGDMCNYSPFIVEFHALELQTILDAAIGRSSNSP